MKTNYLPVMAPLDLANGNTIQWRFAPRTLIIDDVTDYVVGMYVDIQPRFGVPFNAVLTPRNFDDYQRTKFVGEVLAEIGGHVVGGQIKVGNDILDNIISHAAGDFAKTSIRNMFKHALHAQCGYASLNSNALVVRNAIQSFDLSNP